MGVISRKCWWNHGILANVSEKPGKDVANWVYNKADKWWATWWIVIQRHPACSKAAGLISFQECTYMIHTCMMWNSPDRWIVRWVKRREKRRCDCWVGWIAGLLHPDWYSQCDLMWVWSINCLLTKDYPGESSMNPLDFWAKKFSHFFVWGRHILHHSRVLLPLTLLDVYPLGT